MPTSGCSKLEHGWPARHGQQLLFCRHTGASRVAGGRRRSAGSVALRSGSSTSGTFRTPDPDVVINNDLTDRWGNWQKPSSVNSSKPTAVDGTTSHYEAGPHPPIWTGLRARTPSGSLPASFASLALHSSVRSHLDCRPPVRRHASLTTAAENATRLLMPDCDREEAEDGRVEAGNKSSGTSCDSVSAAENHASHYCSPWFRYCIEKQLSLLIVHWPHCI